MKVTDKKMAVVFEISVQTLTAWKTKYPHRYLSMREYYIKYYVEMQPMPIPTIFKI